MDFNDIIGYEKIKGYLTESVDAGRIPHAQLFAAAEGQGALPMAIAYASYLLGKDKPQHSCKFEGFGTP